MYIHVIYLLFSFTPSVGGKRGLKTALSSIRFEWSSIVPSTKRGKFSPSPRADMTGLPFFFRNRVRRDAVFGGLFQ
jgi:hypothetical protein